MITPFYGIDFGTGSALAIHGPDGPVSKKSLHLSRIAGGRTPALEFIMVLEALLQRGHAVVESATIGSSGCEVADTIALLAHVPHRLYTISNRAVKNYRADHPELGWKKGDRYAKDGQPAPVTLTIYEQAEVHIEDAEIIYLIATQHPERLHHWTGPSDPIERVHSSVRPMDKRGYRDERAEALMRLIPGYNSLPDDLKEILGNGRDYSRSVVMPFAMSTEEPYLEEGPREERRRRYEKIVGLYDRGYPSFYRRATIVWMQENAKRLSGATRIAEVPAETRKEAWKLTQRQVRHFYHLMMAHQGR